jgi:NAD(P)-dependent dehydrogenase (short-subunit alcohol dehydrogenase family)
MSAVTDSAAVVTGAASGIGRSIALRFAAKGWHVLCCDLESAREPLGGEASTEALAAERGGSAEFVACDVRSDEDLERVGELVRASGRALWAAAINAGVLPAPLSILEEEPAEHRRVMAVNEEGAWLTCRMVSRVMVEQNAGGRIVFTASGAGLLGEPRSSTYCSSKGAVVNLTRAVALDLAPFGITVNAVCPGWIETPLAAPWLADVEYRSAAVAETPLRRLGTTEDVAGAVAFLASQDAAWITGVALPVDGGFVCR